MTDTQRLKASCDLRRLVEQDLGQPLARGGRAFLWKCPFHHEKRGLSLAVWADGYYCFGKCDRGGDALDWLQRYRRLSFTEAVQLLGAPLETDTPPHRPPNDVGSAPPDAAWQEAAERVVAYAETILWSPPGENALLYLLNRGLTSATIRAARLGLIPGGGWTKVAGLNVPCGIAIPWFAGGDLWAVKVRRASGEPKYTQIAGGGRGLYNADALIDRQRPALICEGEFDTLLAQQEAGQLIAAVSPGALRASSIPGGMAISSAAPRFWSRLTMMLPDSGGAAAAAALAARTHPPRPSRQGHHRVLSRRRRYLFLDRDNAEQPDNFERAVRAGLGSLSGFPDR